jgi:hypothetical protein
MSVKARVRQCTLFVEGRRSRGPKWFKYFHFALQEAISTRWCKTKKRREYIIYRSPRQRSKQENVGRQRLSWFFLLHIMPEMCRILQCIWPSAHRRLNQLTWAIWTNWEILSQVASNCGCGGTCCLLLLHEHLESSLHGFGTFGIENDILLISTQQIVYKCGMDKGGDSLRCGIPRTKPTNLNRYFEHTRVYNTS